MKVSRTAQRLSALVLGVGLCVPGSALAAAPGPGPTAKPKTAAPTVQGDEDADADAEADEESSASEQAAPAEEPTDAGPSDATEPSEAEPSEAEPTDTEPTNATEPEPEPEPEVDAVTVRPRAASDATEPKLVAPAPAPEIVIDPRRRLSDERIFLRASLISFGVATAAVVPMVIDLHQRASAGRAIDRLDTDSEQAARADAEAYRSRMTTLAIAGGVVAGVQLVTGAVLLGVHLHGKQSRRHLLSPAMGPGQLGLVWRARF